MNTGVVNDSLKLSLNIFQSIPPIDDWIIVNIAKTQNETFTYPSIPEIPTSFGYSYDAVPKFLNAEGVIEAEMKNLWFTEIKPKTLISPQTDAISVTAIKKKYISKNDSINYYRKWKRDYVDEGPKVAGLYAVLVNKVALSNFYNKYSPKPSIPSLPIMNIENGELHFLGEKVSISGETNILTMNLLIQNINSRVNYKEMYEVRPNTNYESIVKGTKGTSQVHDAVDQVWDHLCEVVYKNQKLKNTLVFARKLGFGIFIDQRQITLAPQSTP